MVKTDSEALGRRPGQQPAPRPPTAAPQVAAEVELQAPVVEVTLLEDRAQVLRRGRTTLPAGRVKLRVAGVSPVLADRTLGASLLSGPPGARVASLSVRRRPLLPSELPSDLEELDAQIRAAAEKLERMRQHRDLLDGEGQLVRDALRRILQDAVVDAGWNRGQPEQWQEGWRRMLERETELCTELIGERFRVEEQEQELADLQRRREAAQRPGERLCAMLEADLLLPGDGGECELAFRYTVPGACWRPQHRARLVRGLDGPRVVFEMDGCVWQNTGEEWRDVQLLFSTQRPSLGLDPPLLLEDVLIGQRRQEGTVVESREQEIRTTGLGPAAEVRLCAELPGIDDGGTPLLLRAAGRATVPSDGRPYRANVLVFESEAEESLVLVAERAEAVLRRCTLVNRSALPLLAGPVDLLADSGPVGRTSLLFVAPGERFALGYGPDPELRVQRRVEQVEAKPGALNRWLRTEHHVALYLSNLGAATKEAEIVERIPVSEVEAVQISYERGPRSPEAAPDADGMLRWIEDLPPNGTRCVEIHHAIEKKRDVVGL